MPQFKVMCYESGISDGKEARNIEARNEREAAERVCGIPLAERGKQGQHRATVWLAEWPDKKTPFFDPPKVD
jgi:hypothetical protein